MSKTVFITGAATGIGCCTARKLNKMGWEVFAGVLPGQDTSELTDNLQNKIHIVEIDITKTASVKKAAKEVANELEGRGLYAIHNNAGVANIATGPLAGASVEETKKIIDINALGMMRVVQAFLPLLHEYGKGARVVNMSSSAARVAVPTAGTYMMSKWQSKHLHAR